MPGWEITARVVDVVQHGGPFPYKIWRDKHPETGKSDWDDLKQLSADGWELVGITPITVTTSITKYLMYTFKRPLP